MSSLLTDKVSNVLKPSKGLNLIITVGNTFRCDDGVGPFIFDKLKHIADLNIINAADRPENIVEDVIAQNPRRIIFIDAADFGKKPGTLDLIPSEHIPETTLSTHAIPLNVIAGLIKNETGCEVFFVGIQAKNFSLGEGLSAEVKNAAQAVISFIEGIYCSSLKERHKNA